MAKLSKRGTFMLVTLETDRGGIVRGIRSDGHILVRKKHGGHVDLGRVTPGRTVAEFAARWREKYPTLTVRLHTDGIVVPNPPEKHAAAVAAKKRRHDAAAAQDREERAAEAAILPSDPMAALDATVLPYVAAAVRARRMLHDGRLRYIAGMARFHGGATGGDLGTVFLAQWALPKDYAHVAMLDTLADKVAIAVFGTDRAAVDAWARTGMLG